MWKMTLGKIASTVILLAGFWVIPDSARGHFIWLVPQRTDGGTTVQVYFAEDAAPDDPDLLDRITDLRVSHLQVGSEPRPVELTRNGDTLSGRTEGAATQNGLFICSHDYGVLSRGGASFRLIYYAKSGPVAGHPVWSQVDCSDRLRLDVVPVALEKSVRVQVRFDRRPIENAEVKIIGPGMDDLVAQTNSQGEVEFPRAKQGLYSIRARHIEPAGGDLEGKHYASVRHYSTVALNLSKNELTSAVPHWEPLPHPVTSIGSVINGAFVYVYGGHMGRAHSYSTEEQNNALWRAPISGGSWETVSHGPGLQGLALVSHGGSIYRIGGMTAKNAKEEEHDLWSQSSVACFDPAQGTWTDLPDLPESRSSHDAGLIGDHLYVVGGWTIAGNSENSWLDSAWVMDLSAQRKAWKRIADPPFHRRALAVVGHEERLYAIGGIQEEGGPTTRVDIYDPSVDEWFEGPYLVGKEGITGFGAATVVAGGELFVSTIKGDLQRLSADETKWEIVAETSTARFFHRLLPIDNSHIMVVGGGNMESGRFDNVELLEVNADLSVVP